MNESFVAELYGANFEGLRLGQWYDRPGQEVVSGAEFRARVVSKAAELRDHDVGQGQVVAIRETTPLLFAVNYLAAGSLGAVVLPIERSLTPDTEADRLRQTGAVALIDGTGFAPIAATTELTPLPAGTAQILFTGGTTGTPKAVLQTRRGMVANVRAVAEWSRYGSGDVVLGTLPLFHCYGIFWTILAPMLTNASVDAFGRFSRSAMEQDLPSPTAWPTVPAAVEMLLRSAVGERIDWSGLRFCMVGGAPSAGDLSERFRAVTGKPVLNSYGATEATSFVSAPDMATRAQEPGDVGAPAAGVLAREGTRHGEFCELELGGPAIMTGYLGDPEATARALTPDGWLRTGDLFELSAAGTIVLRGRLRAFINRGGEKIDPGTVCAAVVRHPGVSDCVAFGVPDETFGEVVGCLIESKQDLDIAQIREFLSSLLRPYEVPSVIRTVAKLPRNAVGKIAPDGARALLSTATS
ncbi:class I adenylate-forming enzyme family protein [Rhodococcus sp. NPDC059968]|uniref:class I adenylate-forming enzyme family protein n=1 Tax=Rhodococcus sp. NPDC059968 TaxID=3347017 RepID=UPI00366B157B